MSKKQDEKLLSPGEKPEEPYNVKLDLYFWLQALVMALVGIILVFTVVGRLTPVDGGSMLPTLHHGDMMVVRSLGYTPEPGDVVVLTKRFVKPEGQVVDAPIVKRVIAVGGQHVEIDYDTGAVLVDGETLDEDYILEPMSQMFWQENISVDVPEGSVFVMGDNRNVSLDSRYPGLGVVDQRYILGHAMLVLFPFGDFGLID